ncbi:MAG: hypothetical protein RJA61_154 [Candidatus Parcubacteria bacterium]|jgi:putative endonuclease
MPSEKRKIGDIGEEIACRFLMKRGFSIIERNYLKRWGEIDIVAQKDIKTYFFEVKTLRFSSESAFRPEDNVHMGKLERLRKVIETYVAHKKVKGEYQCDLITVVLDFDTKEAKVERLEHIL